MAQYNTLNVKLSNSRFHKLKSRIKNGTEITLKVSSNVVEDSNDENNFPHKLLLTNTQIFVNFPANIKLSKIQLHKIGLSGGFLSRLFSAGTQRSGDVPWRSYRGSNVGTYKGPSGDS